MFVVALDYFLIYFGNPIRNCLTPELSRSRSRRGGSNDELCACLTMDVHQDIPKISVGPGRTVVVFP